MTVGKIGELASSGDAVSRSLQYVRRPSMTLPEGVKPRVDIVKPLFHITKLFRRYKKVTIITDIRAV